MTHFLSKSSLLAGIAAIFLATAACSPPAETPTETTVEAPTQERIVAMLDEIAEDIREETVNYRNDEKVRMLREQQPATFVERLKAQNQLSVQLLRAGKTEESLAELNNTIELLEQAEQLTDRNRFTLDRLAAIAWMRLGEQENCIRNHTIDSCLLPVRGAGVHELERGSRNAIELYTSLLERKPDDLGHRWLLNLAYQTLGEYPDGVPERWRIPPEIYEAEQELPRFRDIAMSAGVAHVSLSGGTAMDDFDGDGLLDIVASAWGVTDPLKFFRNEGDGSFSDRSKEAGLEGQRGGLNLSHADYDNDGDLDLFIIRGAWLASSGEHPNSLLRNDGKGHFTDVTIEAGLLSLNPAHAGVWADFDGDGWVDLFVGNESRGLPRPSELWRNNGDGTFSNVATQYGLNHVGFIKGAAWGDANNDGRPDLYLSCLVEPNRLYLNQGPGQPFREVGRAAGVTRPERSFPTWFFDFDNDGHEDIVAATFSNFGGEALDKVVADYLDAPSDAETLRLFRNRGDGTFEDVSEQLGVDRVLLAMGANFGDIDGDGWLDMYFGTGEPALFTLVPNVMLRNDGGRRFLDVTESGGFGNLQKGHGVAFGDVDNDGDEDLYVVMGGAYSGDVYQNILFENPGHGNRFITLRLEGTASNRAAIGARIRIDLVNEDGTRRSIHRTVSTGGSFGSSSLQQEIGLGRATAIEAIEIRWPGSGNIDRLTDLPLDRVVKVREGDGVAVPVEVPSVAFSGDHAGHH